MTFNTLKPSDTFLFNAGHHPDQDWVLATVQTADSERVYAKFNPIAQNGQESIVMSRRDWRHFTEAGDIKPV
jgi:hypothetical protein